jgi:predicted nucleotidyltransferase component of viral defense system
LSSGSQKRPRAAKRSAKPAPTRTRSASPGTAPVELSAWQLQVLDAVAASKLASEVVFGGGAALAVRHLHHRRSEDLDFFLPRELEDGELRPLTRHLVAEGVRIDEQQVGPRRSLLLLQGKKEIGRVDFAFYPYDPIARRERWRGLVVESLLDMTVNKVQALITRFRPRDFVDLYFLLREGPERDLDRLLDFVRAKFDAGADRLALAQNMLRATGINELPAMLRPVTREDLVAFFEEQARALVRRG